jgi:uncharacterized protein involved in exopolysaccharide biosynthesis
MVITALDQHMTFGTDQQPNTADTAEEIKGLSARLNAAQLQWKNTMEQRASLEPLLKKGYVAKTRIIDLDNRIAELQGNVESIKATLAIAQRKLDESGGAQPEQLSKKRADLAAQTAALQDSIAKTPQVEATLNALNREYDNMAAEHRLAKAKTTTAQTGQEMEQDRQAERFEVLEQAIVPEQPISPDRPRILLAGAFGSVGAGVALLILLEVLDKSIRSSMDLERKLQIRPLVTIPYMVTAAERVRNRRRVERLVTSTVVILGLVLWMVHEFYLPLDVLMRQLLQRAGIVG